MFKVDGLKIEMFEGDFGEVLPMTIINGEVLEHDILRFIIKDTMFNIIIDKKLNVENNAFDFSLTEEETKLLSTGTYSWGLRQYRNDTLVDTLTANNCFEVRKW